MSPTARLAEIAELIESHWPWGLRDDGRFLLAALREAERQRDGFAACQVEYAEKTMAAVRRAEEAEKRIKDADAYLADPAGNPIDALNFARAALAVADEKWVIPEGDERCDEPKDACKCMKRKGHDGSHACAHGEWLAVADEEQP